MNKIDIIIEKVINKSKHVFFEYTSKDFGVKRRIVTMEDCVDVSFIEDLIKEAISLKKLNDKNKKKQ